MSTTKVTQNGGEQQRLVNANHFQRLLADSLRDAVSTSEEWSRFAASFMQLAIACPGVRPAQRMVELVNAVHPFCKATTIVDMGCGPGQITNEVVTRYGGTIPPSARVIAADNNENFLHQIRARKRGEIENGNVSWKRTEALQCDIHDCQPFSDGSVSHMLAGFVIFLVPDPTQALRSIHRTLAPNGLLAASSWQSSEWADMMEYPAKVRPDLVMPKMPEAWTTEAGAKDSLEAAGFRSVQVHRVQSFMPFESHDEVCRFILLRFPPSARVCAQMTAEELVKTRDLMIADLKLKYPTAPNRMSGIALVAICWKQV